MHHVNEGEIAVLEAADCGRWPSHRSVARFLTPTRPMEPGGGVAGGCEPGPTVACLVRFDRCIFLSLMGL